MRVSRDCRTYKSIRIHFVFFEDFEINHCRHHEAFLWTFSIFMFITKEEDEEISFLYYAGIFTNPLFTIATAIYSFSQSFLGFQYFFVKKQIICLSALYLNVCSFFSLHVHESFYLDFMMESLWTFKSKQQSSN